MHGRVEYPKVNGRALVHLKGVIRRDSRESLSAHALWNFIGPKNGRSIEALAKQFVAVIISLHLRLTLASLSRSKSTVFAYVAIGMRSGMQLAETASSNCKLGAERSYIGENTYHGSPV